MAVAILASPVEVGGQFYAPPSQAAPGAAPGLYAGIEAQGGDWMRLACQVATRAVAAGGGPFGAVLLQVDAAGGQVLRYWACHNQVTASKDPTAHAEILAIRSACASLGVFDLGAIRREDAALPQPGPLSYGVLFSSAEPCPMCYAALCWARLPQLQFAATRVDAAAPGVDFSDAAIYQELDQPYAARPRRVYHCAVDNALDAFNLWKRSDKAPY